MCLLHLFYCEHCRKFFKIPKLERNPETFSTLTLVQDWQCSNSGCFKKLQFLEHPHYRNLGSIFISPVTCPPRDTGCTKETCNILAVLIKCWELLDPDLNIRSCWPTIFFFQPAPASRAVPQNGHLFLQTGASSSIRQDPKSSPKRGLLVRRRRLRARVGGNPPPTNGPRSRSRRPIRRPAEGTREQSPGEKAGPPGSPWAKEREPLPSPPQASLPGLDAGHFRCTNAVLLLCIPTEISKTITFLCFIFF